MMEELKDYVIYIDEANWNKSNIPFLLYHNERYWKWSRTIPPEDKIWFIKSFNYHDTYDRDIYTHLHLANLTKYSREELMLKLI